MSVFGKNAQASRKRRKNAHSTSVCACGVLGVEAAAEAADDADDATGVEARIDEAASKRACMTDVSGVGDWCART